MEIGEDTIIAQCYILKKGDENNICYLSADNLFIKSKGIVSHFPIDSIMNISFKHKILLMPIIFGGILAPFALIAVFNGYYNVWLMLSLMMGGLAILYYGIEGGQTMSVQTNVKEYDFFLKSVSPNLKSFVSFVINYQHRGEDALIYYFTLSEDHWHQAQSLGYIDSDEPILLSPLRSGPTTDIVELSVNLSTIPDSIAYTMSEELNKLVPTIEKRISVSDIIIPDKKD